MFSLQYTIPHVLCKCLYFLAELQQAQFIITELCLRNSFLAGHLKTATLTKHQKAARCGLCGTPKDNGRSLDLYLSLELKIDTEIDVLSLSQNHLAFQKVC